MFALVNCPADTVSVGMTIGVKKSIWACVTEITYFYKHVQPDIKMNNLWRKCNLLMCDTRALANDTNIYVRSSVMTNCFQSSNYAPCTHIQINAKKISFKYYFVIEFLIFKILCLIFVLILISFHALNAACSN